MDALSTGALFFAVLSVLVFIHELGHYLMARIIGVEVDEFGLGLPPRAWGKKIGKTIYSLNWLPIGGFVRLKGEDETEDEHGKVAKKDLSKYFWARSKTERSLILVAGVTMNFLLAVVVTTYLLVTGVKEPSGVVRVTTVSEQSPASEAGIAVGDHIATVSWAGNGDETETRQIKTPTDLIDATKNHGGQRVQLTIVRGEEAMIKIITPRTNPPQGQGPLGIAISDLETKYYPITEAPMVAVRINVERAGTMLFSLIDMAFRFVTLKPVDSQIAGPIGIAQVTGQAAKFGFRALLEFVTLLSLNLAVLNVLPFPALDGGRLAFIFVEKILGKKVRPAFEKNAHSIGMILLLLFIVLVSINDVLKLLRGA